jgi:DNA end-binding protein Ku
MRSIWKGHIRFSLVMIPIRIYNAIDTAQTIRFNQLHKECHGPVGYLKRCKKCSEQLTTQDIVKGYQYEPEQYVLFEAQDFEKVKLKSTKVIEIEAFVDAAEIHPTLFDAPYFAGPESDVGSKSYRLLCEALKESGKVGIGRVVLRDREDVVVIAAHREGLILYKLRYPSEIRKIANVPKLGDPSDIDREQLELARHLLDSMTTTLSGIETKNRYNDALREIIEAKVAGKEVVAMEEEDRPVVDIMTALKQSIEDAKTRRQPMVRATGKAAKAKPAGKKEKGRKRKRA